MLRIETLVATRHIAAYTLHGPHADAVQVAPDDRPRRTAVFKTATAAERFKTLCTKNLLELGVTTGDLNAFQHVVRTSRPVLTDGSAFEPNELVYLVTIE